MALEEKRQREREREGEVWPVLAKFQAGLLINAASHLHIAHILFNISAELCLPECTAIRGGRA